MIKALFSIACLAGGTVVLADIATGVTCSFSNGPAITDPNSCRLTSSTGSSAAATANAGFTLAFTASSFSSLSVQQNADAAGDGPVTGPAVPTFTAVTSSQAFVNETLFTAGSVRSGFVQINAFGGNGRGDGSAHMNVSLGPIQVFCSDNIYGSGYPNCKLFPDSQRDPPSYQIPPYGNPVSVEYVFTLGQAFALSYSGILNVSHTDLPGGGTTAFNNIGFQFRFFEADGVTPVAVQAVPEPRTLALGGVALGVLIMVKRKFQR